jgi:hypothetical protein
LGLSPRYRHADEANSEAVPFFPNDGDFMNRQVLIIATTILLVLCWSGPGFETQAAQSEAVLDADAILERLKQLEGTWHGDGGSLGGNSSSVVHEFRVVAGESVVMEIMDPEGEREINMYHVNGTDVVMTHYCGGGSQPRLKLDYARATSESMPFVFLDATNLENPAEDRHIHAGKIVFVDANHLESWWTVYKEGREVAQSRFRLERTSNPQILE